jgi:hypothetical protein
MKRKNAGYDGWAKYIGLKMGRLTFKGYYKSPRNKNVIAICDCDCGNKDVEVQATRWKNRLVNSCGCLASELAYARLKKYNVYDLSGPYGMGITFSGYTFYFDLEDFDKIKKYCWHKHKDGYLRTCLYTENGKNKYILMHKLIVLNGDPLLEIDHINGNPYDNRKENLRVVSHKVNMNNAKMRSSNKSGITGLSFSNNEKRWKVSFADIHIGTFIYKDDAIKARLMKEKEILGDAAPQKHLFEQYGIV